MTITQAQQDMRYAYHGGGFGVLVSGLVWLLAMVVALGVSDWASMLTLFFGGMAIFPLSVALSKLFGRPGRHGAGNPLGTAAIESLAILFVGLFVAFASARFGHFFFYPVMLLAIGSRYMGFNTLYGNRLYWLLGALLMAAGALLLMLKAPPWQGAASGAVLEITFASLFLWQQKTSKEIAHDN